MLRAYNSLLLDQRQNLAHYSAMDMCLPLLEALERAQLRESIVARVRKCARCHSKRKFSFLLAHELSKHKTAPHDEPTAPSISASLLIMRVMHHLYCDLMYSSQLLSITARNMQFRVASHPGST